MKPYNTLLASLWLGLFSWLLSPLTLWAYVATDSASLKQLLKIIVGLSFVGILLSACLFLFLVMSWLLTGKSFRYLTLSLLATFFARRFCHLETKQSFSLENESVSTPSQSIRRRANRSLYTLNVTVLPEEAYLTWHLPSSYESQVLMSRLFPYLKMALNNRLPHYVFNDITVIKGNYYGARAVHH
ncbi:hypothetical protein ACEF17_09370 [Streptococcus hyovaginalis]